MKIFKKNLSEDLESQKNPQTNKMTDFFYKMILASKPNEQGFGIAIAFGIGLLLMILGLASIVQSSNNKMNATSNENAVQSLAVTEGAVNTLLGDLTSSQKRFLLLYNKSVWDSWNGKGTPPSAITKVLNDTGAGISNVCNLGDANGDGQVTKDDLISKAWTPPVKEGSVGTKGIASAGTFNLVDYTYDDAADIGTMTVKGILNKNTTSRSQLQATINVTPNSGAAGVGAAALLADDMTIDKANVYSNTVICTDPSKCIIDCQGKSQPSYDDLEKSLGVDTAKNGGFVNTLDGKDANIVVTAMSVPAIPKTTNTAKITTLNGSGAIDPTNATYNKFDSIDLDGDGDIDQRRWYVQVTGWNGAITVDTSKINNTTNSNGEKVKDIVGIYVADSVKLTGNGGIQPLSGLPEDGEIRLYGGFADQTNTDVTQLWEFGGTVCIAAMIHAPKATLDFSQGNGCKTLMNSAGLAKGGSDTPNVYGAIWAKIIGADSSNTAIFWEDPSLTKQLGGEFPQTTGVNSIKVSAITNLTRQEAP